MSCEVNNDVINSSCIRQKYGAEAIIWSIGTRRDDLMVSGVRRLFYAFGSPTYYCPGHACWCAAGVGAAIATYGAEAL